MAAKFVAAGAIASGTAEVKPDWPAGIQEGDIGFLICESANQAISLRIPSGFQQIGTQQGTGTAGGTSSTLLAVFWCRVTGPSMPQPTIADPGDHVAGIIVVYRDAAEGPYPFDGVAGGVKAAASTTTTWDALTTTVADCLILHFATRQNDATTAAWSAQTNANLTGIAERVDTGTTQGNGGGFTLFEGVKATAGSTGASTATVTSTLDGHMTIALRPSRTNPQTIRNFQNPKGGDGMGLTEMTRP